MKRAWISSQEDNYVSAQKVETPTESMDVENLLRRLLSKVETKDSEYGSIVEQEGMVAVLFEIELDGARYMLTQSVVTAATADAALSPREQEVARLVAKGLSNKAIAKVLEISFWTVSTHLRRIFNKLGVSSRAEMISKAMQDGLLN